jgi:hypothetical protein
MKYLFTPLTANPVAFNASSWTSTGAALPVTTPATVDLLMHRVTLVAPVQATLAGITFTIVGTDADGNAKTETGLVGPASGATVTSVGYFATITSIMPSATMGGLIVSVGTDQVGVSQALPLDWRSIVGAMYDVAVTGTINYSIQETFDNIYNLARPELALWESSISGLTSKTATVQAMGSMSANAARLIVNSVTNTATLGWRTIQSSQQAG